MFQRGRVLVVLIEVYIVCCFQCLSVSANNFLFQETGTLVQETVVGDSVPSELSLPNVPEVLRTPGERASYIITHFWDALDFCDTLRSHNMRFMEQNFSNFISVFPYADEQARQSAVGTLLYRAETDSGAYVLIRNLAEKYLYEPNSPMLSEDYYILFLERLVSSPVLEEYGTLRLRRQLEAARKNRPGMIAADFTYTMRDGHSTTLHNTIGDGDLLLIFYDPDCEHCKETIAELQASEVLSNVLASGKMKVLAVYSGDSYQLWQQTATLLPADWVIGYDSGVLQENGSYVLRAMPTLYLIDHDKKVVLKDVLPAQLIYLLTQHAA